MCEGIWGVSQEGKGEKGEGEGKEGMKASWQGDERDGGRRVRERE